MKKFFIKIVIFFVIVLVVDKSIGASLDYMRDNARSGYNKELNYVFNQVCPDILILGSSRALHHYVPEILEDSLNMTCYNAGSNACSIIPMYCRFRNIAKRKNPKIIIYEVYSETDYFINEISRNEDDVRIYYDNDEVGKVYDDVKPDDRLKMISSLYRYNSKFGNTIGAFLIESQLSQLKSKGYSPFEGEITRDPLKIETHIGDVDSVKMKYLIQLIKQTRERGIKLVFTISPWYKCPNDEEYKILSQLSEQYGIPLISHLKDERFIYNRTFFTDQSHLNDKGARKYTKTIVSELKKIIEDAK